MSDAIDFVLQGLSAVLLFVGLWMMGDRRRLGPLLVCIAELLCLVVGVMHGVWSLILIGGVLFVIQGRNFIKWNREGVRW